MSRPARHLAAILFWPLLAGCGSSSSSGSPAHDEEPTSVPFTLYTHCGVESARIDGRWWHAEPPLYDDTGSGPPTGWSDPYQDGQLTVGSSDRAVFEANGQRVVLVPAEDDEPVRVCR